MEKNLDISLLLDFYGPMLTDKQREVVGYYYNEDLSLAEIAQHSGITRQGVRDSIKRAEYQLADCEQKLCLLARFRRIQSGLDEIIRLAGEIREDTARFAHLKAQASRAGEIVRLATEIGDN